MAALLKFIGGCNHVNIVILLLLLHFKSYMSMNSTSSSFGVSPRIINGDIVEPPDKYPFMVRLWNDNFWAGCGGSLIASNVVLSAAHCGVPSHVMFGEGFNRIRIKVQKGFIHEQYDSTQVHNDIMLLQLEEDAPSGVYDVIELNHNGADIVVSENVEVTVIGWGRTELDNDGTSLSLRETNLDLYSDVACDDYLSSPYILEAMKAESYDNSGKVCASRSNTDACQGDSGGPLFLQHSETEAYYQVGIVSFGIDCALEDHPGIYTDIAYYFGWIQNKLCSGEDPMSLNATICSDGGTYSPIQSPAVPSPTMGPYNDMFDDECDEELNEISSNPEVQFVEAIQNNLISVCNGYNCIIDYSSTTDLMYSACEIAGGDAQTFNFHFECSGEEKVTVDYINLSSCRGKSCDPQAFEQYYEDYFQGVLESNDIVDSCVSGSEPFSTGYALFRRSNWILSMMLILMMRLE